MAYFLVGCALLIVILLAGRLLVKADPQKLAAGLRKAGGVAALALAGFLILRGAIPMKRLAQSSPKGPFFVRTR